MVLAGDMFRQRIDEIFKGLLNTFGIADAILIVGYDVDDRDPNKTLEMSNADMPARKVKAEQK